MTRRLALLLALALPLLAAGCNDDDDSVTTRSVKRYGALGASDAWGVGAEPRENGYVWLVADWLEGSFDDVPLLNAGIPGATADLILSVEVPLVIDHGPGAVTLWTGVNDISQGRSAFDFERDLGDILEELRSRTRAQVYIGNIPDITRLPKYVANPDPDVTPARVALWNGIIGSKASQHGAYVVDLAATPLATDPRYVAEDGFHPNNAGHRLIADTFIAVMASTLTAEAPQLRSLAVVP